MCRKMVDAVLQMSEYNRFSKGIFSWVGFKTEWLEYENVERSAGETKWSLRQLFKYSLEGITGFSVAPLSVAAVLGVVFCGVSFFMILFLVIRTLIWGDPVAGWLRGLRDPVYGRDPTALHGNHGRVSLENLSGIQTSSDLYCKEFQL